MPKAKKSKIQEIADLSYKLQDIYEYVSNRDLIFTEVPSTRVFVPQMTDKEIEDFQKTGLEKFYRGVHPVVLYVDQRVAFPINSSLLQPYYTYLRYLVSTRDTIWVYAIPLTSREVREIYSAVVGEDDLPESFDEALETFSESFLLDLPAPPEPEDALTGGMDSMPINEEAIKGSVYEQKILLPTISFFNRYFKEYPAGSRKPQKLQSVEAYGKVPVLSGHTGIAKSAIVKQLEDEGDTSNVVEMVFSEDPEVILGLRPRVEVIKVGSMAYRELSEVVFSLSSDGEKVFYQNPFLGRFFFSSDQFTFSVRRLLLEAIKDGRVVVKGDRPISARTGNPLDTRGAVNSSDPEERYLARLVYWSRPVVIFLDELDRNHELFVRNLLTSFVYSRSLQGGLTFYSVKFVAAWNRPLDVPGEREALSRFYITAATQSSNPSGVGEAAFAARLDVIPIYPNDPSTYLPVVEYLVSVFDSTEGSGNLSGVRKFLNKLVSTRLSDRDGDPLYNYTLLYYLPPELFDPDISDDAKNRALLSGFATFRSYERLFRYLSKLKEAGGDVNLHFVRSILGGLFPLRKNDVHSPHPGVARARGVMADAFSQLVKENFGYDPYKPPEGKSLPSGRTEDILEASLLSGVPVALYSPPGYAKTSRAKALVFKANREFFQKIRSNKEFRAEVVRFISSIRPELSDSLNDVDNVIAFLASELLVYEIGSEHAHNPAMISGANAPLSAPVHPEISLLAKSLSEASQGRISRETAEAMILSSLPEGTATIVKRRVPTARTHQMRQTLERFEDARAVVILDEFTRADFVTQGSFFDALSEGIIGGEYFPPNLMDRVTIVATGNYSSSVFGTSVSDIDGALVARFANVFYLEPSDEDLDDFLSYLADMVDRTLEGASAGAREDVRSYILAGVGEPNNGSLDTLRGVLKSMVSVSGRSEAIVALKSYLMEQEWSDDREGYDARTRAGLLSPRDFSQMLALRILPKWLPHALLFEEMTESWDRARSAIDSMASPGFYQFCSRVIEEHLKPLVESANPYLVVSRLSEANDRGFIPQTGLSPFQVVLLPDPQILRGLKSIYREDRDVARTFDGLKYRPLGPEYGQVPLPEAVSRLVESGINHLGDVPYAVLHSGRAMRLLSGIDWDALSGGSKADGKSVVQALSAYVYLMLLGTLAYHDSVAKDLQTYMVYDLWGDKEVFFPGSVLDVSGKDPEAAVADLAASRDEQKQAFLHHLSTLYYLYSRAKVSALVQGMTSKATGGGVKEAVEEDLERYVFAGLRKEYGTSNVLHAIESIVKEMESGETPASPYVLSAVSVASFISDRINRALVDRYGVDLGVVRLAGELASRGELEEASLPTNVVEALEYYRYLLADEPTIAARLGISFDPEKRGAMQEGVEELLRYLLGKVGAYVSIDSNEAKKYVDSGGDYSYEYVSGKLAEARRLLSGAGVEMVFTTEQAGPVSPEDVPFVPTIGAFAPGSHSTFAGALVVPVEPYIVDGDAISQIPHFLSIYVLRKERDGLYFTYYPIRFMTPIRDYFFKKETKKIKEDESGVVLLHQNYVHIIFETGSSLVLSTVSEDEVSPEIASAVGSVLSSEEFEEISKEHRDNPYLASLVAELETIAGKRESVVVYGRTPGFETDMETKGYDYKADPRALASFVRSTNRLILSDTASSFVAAISSIQALKEHYFERYDVDVNRVSSLVSGQVLSTLPASRELSGSDSSDISLDDLDIGLDLDLGPDGRLSGDDMDAKVDRGRAGQKDAGRAVGGSPETGPGERAGEIKYGLNPKATSRLSIRLLTLLKVALDKSRASLLK